MNKILDLLDLDRKYNIYLLSFIADAFINHFKTKQTFKEVVSQNLTSLLSIQVSFSGCKSLYET